MTLEKNRPMILIKGPMPLLVILSVLILLIAAPPFLIATGNGLFNLDVQFCAVLGMFGILGVCIRILYRVATRSMPKPVVSFLLCLAALISGLMMNTHHYFAAIMEGMGAEHVRTAILRTPDFVRFVELSREKMISNNESEKVIRNEPEIPDVLRNGFKHYSLAIFFILNPEKHDDFRVRIRWSNKIYKWVLVNDAEHSVFWDQFPPDFVNLTEGWWLGVYTIVDD